MSVPAALFLAYGVALACLTIVFLADEWMKGRR